MDRTESAPYTRVEEPPVEAAVSEATGGLAAGPSGDRKRDSRAPVREGELAQLRQTVSSHAVVDQAIGIVVSLAGLRAEDGWDVLREISQHTDIKMRHVAELIVEWAQTGHLASDIRHQLERSMTTRASLRPEPG